MSNELTLFDSEGQKRWADISESIKKSAQDRRRKRTPSAKIKKREGGEGKTFSYVDRPDYQIWLDDTFPAWTTDNLKLWTEVATRSVEGAVQTVPVLFCASFDLIVIDSGAAKRRVPCVGTCAVSEKELGRTNSQLLKNKYKIALTEAYKTGCEWLGAFFDLRADDEAREKAAQPPTKEQFDRFKIILNQVPVEHKDVTTKAWNKQNATSAVEFLSTLEQKVNNIIKVEVGTDLTGGRT